MENDIKDYLHYYLGCECQVKYFDKSAELTGISYDGQQRQWWCYFENNEASYAKIEEIKPILRPLSDITEEEGKDIFNTAWVFVTISHIGGYTPDQFIKCLKYGFDMFGLIESGLAIDKTKM